MSKVLLLGIVEKQLEDIVLKTPVRWDCRVENCDGKPKWLTMWTWSTLEFHDVLVGDEGSIILSPRIFHLPNTALPEISVKTFRGKEHIST